MRILTSSLWLPFRNWCSSVGVAQQTIARLLFDRRHTTEPKTKASCTLGGGGGEAGHLVGRGRT